MKFKRTERIGAIVKILSDNPNKIYTLSFFTEKFNAAKSTISEDLLVVKDVFEKLELGRVITISGAAGGVKYIPKTSIEENKQFLMELCEKINDDSRKLSGGFLYLIDLIYNPAIVAKIGKIFASNLDYSEADYVVTMETKGIPMALMTAKAMNLPLVIIRKDMKVSEGPTLSMTYVTGGSNKVESMSLPRKALKPDSKVIIIDDKITSTGSANMDLRSFMLNFEINAFIYDKEVIDIMTKDFLEDMKNSEELKLEEFNNRSMIKKVKESIARLFSPIL